MMRLRDLLGHIPQQKIRLGVWVGARLGPFVGRVRDAWKVLTGRAWAQTRSTGEPMELSDRQIQNIRDHLASRPQPPVWSVSKDDFMPSYYLYEVMVAGGSLILRPTGAEPRLPRLTIQAVGKADGIITIDEHGKVDPPGALARRPV